MFNFKNKKHHHDQTTFEHTEPARLSAKKPEEKGSEEDDKEYPRGIKLSLIYISLLFAVFLTALDGTIIATAIPTITSEFNSLSQYAWYNTAFLLTICAFQLPFGRAYTLLNVKWTFLVAIVIFEVGSAVCGAAPTSVALIIGRAIAGIGAAGIGGGAFIIAADVTPLSRRAIFTGALGGVFGIASVVGPLLGGAFTTKVSWRWCFYINLPLGAAVLVIVFFCLPQLAPKDSHRFRGQNWWQNAKKFDPIGTLLLIPLIICLLLALQWGGQMYPWSDGRIIALLVVFGVLLIAWIIVQYVENENATIPRKVAGQRTVAFASVCTSCAAAAFFVVIYNLPLWFQAVKQNDAELSGIHQIPLIASLVISSLFAGGMVALLGYYNPWLFFGAIMMAVGSGLMSTLSVNSGIGSWLSYQIIFGIGIGCNLEQCNIAVQAALPPEKIPAGVSLVQFARSLGGSIGLSIAENIFEERLRSLLHQQLPNLNPNIVTGSGATNLVANVRAAVDGNEAVVNTVIQIYNRAITDMFYVSVGLACVAFLTAFGVEWKNVKKEKQPKTEDTEKGETSM